jgi:uncharacterized OsmC-like protein
MTSREGFAATVPEAPTAYTVSGRTSAAGESEVDTAEQTITIDASWGTPSSGAPGPAHLLAAAFAACLLKNLARAAQLLQFRYRDAEVEVTARRQDRPPKLVEITYALRIATDEPQRRVDLVHLNLRKHGTVYNTLAATCDVHGDVVVATDPPPATM